MGLDQYAYALPHDGSRQQVDFDLNGDDVELVFTWRKHANLQGWMDRLYEEKGGQFKDEMFGASINTTDSVELDLDDIEALVAAMDEGELPHTDGFFFGKSTYQDEVETREFCGLARKILNSVKRVVYSAWW